MEEIRKSGCTITFEEKHCSAVISSTVEYSYYFIGEKTYKLPITCRTVIPLFKLKKA